MPRLGLNPEQRKAIEIVESTNAASSLFSARQLATLINPRTFPSANQPRLRKTLEQNVLLGLRGTVLILKHLKDPYRSRVIHSNEFHWLIEEAYGLQQPGKVGPLPLPTTIQNFINAFESLIVSAPKPFRHLLVRLNQPAIELLIAIIQNELARSGPTEEEQNERKQLLPKIEAWLHPDYVNQIRSSEYQE